MSDEEVAVEVQNRIMIKVGDVDIDLTGSAKDIDSIMQKRIQEESWSNAISSIRSVREIAIAAARRAAEESGLPERGAAFHTLCNNNNLTRKPDQVLAAIQYLREVEGVHDSPPRAVSYTHLTLPTKA